MKPTIKNLRFYFVKAMGLKLVLPEDQYKSDLNFLVPIETEKAILYIL